MKLSELLKKVNLAVNAVNNWLVVYKFTLNANKLQCIDFNLKHIRLPKLTH